MTSGHTVELADLFEEEFDPVLREADEPDWNNPAKVYSAEVRAEMARIERNEATVLVFPVYWWSAPALLKGWIDRVWNNGWAYGEATYPHKQVLMLAVAGGTQSSFAKRGYDQAITTQLETGVLRYCGVENPRLELLYGSLEDEETIAKILAIARLLGSSI